MIPMKKVDDGGAHPPIVAPELHKR